MSDVAQVVASALFLLVSIGTSVYAAIWVTSRLHLSPVTGTGTSFVLFNFFIRAFVFFIVVSVVLTAWGPVLFLFKSIFG